MSLFSFFARRSESPSCPSVEIAAARGCQPSPEESGPMSRSAAAEFSWERTIPSRADLGKAVIDEVLRQLESLRWNDRDLFGIRLALEEAVINAIKHGNHFDESKCVAIVCRLTPELLHIEIADEGQGFIPDEVPDPTDPENLEKPSGRGIVLMRSFMSLVSYNEQGNRVIMEKRRGTEEE
jgi:serine/threonine-protein kinase RsbW